MGLKFVTKTAKSNSYGNKRDYDDIKYIVVHYTGNKGDTALDNATYFATSNTRSAGAHVFVDGSGVVYKSVPINRVAWAVGGFYTQANGAGSMYKKATNANTLNIEMCNCANGVPQDVFDDTAELTRYYMKKYDVPASHVLRHWDVNGKSCPAPWASKGSTGWNNFKKAIQGQAVSSSGSTSSGNKNTSTSSAPSYKVGNTYTLQSNMVVRAGAGTNYRAKKHSELTADGQKHDKDKNGCLDKGTRITCQQVKKSGSNIWIKCPSGWIAAYYSGKVYVK